MHVKDENKLTINPIGRSCKEAVQNEGPGNIECHWKIRIND